MEIKKKIIIMGPKVHDIGYRPFLLGIAESMEIERFFVDNSFINEKQVVYALVGSSEENVDSFIEIASSKYPEKSVVEKVEVEDYKGNLMKIESFYRYLTAMQLSKIANYGGKMLDKQDKMLDKQDKMLDKQDKMLDKQDTTIHVLQEVRHDTSDIGNTLSRIENDVRDTKFSLSSFIDRKFHEQENEIAQIKATLARIQEAHEV